MAVHVSSNHRPTVRRLASYGRVLVYPVTLIRVSMLAAPTPPRATMMKLQKKMMVHATTLMKVLTVVDGR